MIHDNKAPMLFSELPMTRPLLALLLAVTSTASAQAAECTKALTLRWEEAMTEAMQLRRLMLKLGPQDPDREIQCRIVKNVTELLVVGKEYFPACDPLDKDRRRITLSKMEALLAKTDTSVCSKLGNGGWGKKR
jgi:hypothetical protein